MTAFDDAPLRGIHWRWTLISGIGDYLDAGAFVGASVSLAIWASTFHISAGVLSIIAGVNAIAVAVGAFVAGRLGDKFGRKRIYTWDLLVYMLGALLAIFAANQAMILIGYIIIGLAIGADVPTAWSLIAEFSPRKHRGKLMSITNIMWYVAAIVILLLALAFQNMHMTGTRLVWASLFIVAVIGYFLRRTLIESPRWSAIHGAEDKVEEATRQLGGTVATNRVSARSVADSSLKQLFRRKYAKPLLLIVPIYVFWGIPASTYGVFFPYILKTLGHTSTSAAYLLDIGWFATAIISVLVIFMPLNDRISRRLLYAISAAFCTAAFLILVLFPFTLTTALINVVLFGFGQGIGLWPLQRIWSTEMFPTEIRNTGQGFIWAAMRFLSGVWALFLLPLVSKTGISVIAIVMTLMFAYNLVVGSIWGPKTSGQSLEEISGSSVGA